MGATILFALVLCSNAVLLSATDQPICDVNNEVGDIARIELGYLDFSEDNELIWKHNKVNIFRRKRRQFITGKQEDIKNDGSLVLHSVTVDQSGPYSAEVFDDHGKQVYSAEKHLCVKEKVFKPDKPLVTCQPASSVQLKCSVKGSNLVQRRNNVIKTMGMTGVLKLNMIEDKDEFLCERFSQHSDPVKVSCSGEKLLFGLNMNIMIAILAGGGGLFLVLVIVLVICCCHRHTQNKNRLSDEEELRLANVTQQQQQQQQQRQRHRQHQQRRQEQESYAVPHGQHQQQAAPRGHALPCPHSQNGDGPTPVPPRSRGKPRSKPPPVPAEDGADEQPPPRPRPRQSAPQHNR